MIPQKDPRKASTRLNKPSTQTNLPKPAAPPNKVGRTTTSRLRPASKLPQSQSQSRTATGRNARGPQKPNTNLYVGIGAGAAIVLVIIVLFLNSGKSAPIEKPKENKTAQTGPATNAPPSDQKRKPTADEMNEVKQAAAKISEARKIFDSIMAETEPGKWDPKGPYKDDLQSAKPELRKAKQLCLDANPIIEKINDQCGSDYLPPECTEYGKWLKMINKALYNLGE